MDKRKGNLDSMKLIIRITEGMIEVVVLAMVYYFFWRTGFERGIFPDYFGKGKYVLSGVYALLVVVVFFNFDGFKFGHLTGTDVLVSQWIALLIVNFITYLQLCLIANVMITPIPILVIMLADMVVSLFFAYIYSWLYHKLYAPKNMIMVFGRDDALALKLKMDTRSDKYVISRLIPVSAGYDQICDEIVNYDAVIINDLPAQMHNDILKFCYENKLRAYIAPKLSDIITRGAVEITLFDTPLLLVKGMGLNITQRFLKRILDIVLSLIGLVIGVPVMLLVAIAIKIEDGGPVFFKQKRVTRDGEIFDIIKFRSMVVDAESEGDVIPATGDDPRITKVGKLIRSARIDELPQLFNILSGKMSVVGPRPERIEHVKMYSEVIPEFVYRQKVKGGLTGYAQIYGKYNTSPYDKLRMDLMYIEKYSLLLDIKLILKTIRIIFKKDSTEGFDKQLETEQMMQQILEKLHAEQMAENAPDSTKKKPRF